MGASSVTGTGLGEAGITRGPGNNRSSFYSNVDPHIVWHGKATLTEGSAVVNLPSNIQVPPSNLAVFVGGKGYSVSKITVDDIMTGFRIVGYYDGTVDYIVIDANNSCFCEDYSLMPV
jgi:hypothetical protein